MLVKRVSPWVGLRRKGADIMVGAGQFRLEARATEEFVRGRERDRAKREGVKGTGVHRTFPLFLGIFASVFGVGFGGGDGVLLWLVRLWIFPSRRLGLGGWRGPGPFYFGRTVGCAA